MLSPPIKEWWPISGQCLDTSQWTVYECKKEPNGGCLVPSIDTTSVAALEGMGWRPFSGVGQAIFSLLCARPEGKKQGKKRKRRMRTGLNVTW